ncbi:CopG family transcriptional regulator [Planctobacterium marinum]|nr:CopG family transcriptional regulator [Planctobacterium marinum]
MRAASSDVSVSELVDEAVRLFMREDQEDLSAISERSNEPDVSYEDFLNELRSDGKI